MADTVCTGNAELPTLNAPCFDAILKSAHQRTALETKLSFKHHSRLPFRTNLVSVLLY